jgi:hypothetical protein
MKKIICFFLIMICGLSGAVFAEDFQIHKGWNLVSINLLNDIAEKKEKNRF